MDKLEEHFISEKSSQGLDILAEIYCMAKAG